MEIRLKPNYYCKCGKWEYPHEDIRKPKLHEKGNIRSHTPEFIACCERFKENVDCNIIKFGDHEDSNTKDPETKFNIQDAGYHGYVGSEPIDYCPFCGEKIEYPNPLI